jgi:GTPase SAR1 family protein
VGKSALTIQATENIYLENSNSTLGFEFFSLNFKIQDKIVKLQIWDTCGQEIYRSLVANFYRSSSIAFIVYSIDKYNVKFKYKIVKKVLIN